MTRILLFLMLLWAAAPWTHGQKGRSEVEEGNQLFHAGEYEKARESYRKALEKVPGSSVATFNLGDSEYKLDEFSGAEKSFLEAIASGNPELLAQAQYNLANSLFKQGRIEESIEGYKQALRLNPADPAAKHNLEFALRQQQEQEKQQPQNQDQSSQENQEEQDQQDQDEGDSSRQPDEQPSENPENQGEGEDQKEDSGESSQENEGEEQEQDQPTQSQQEEDQDETGGQSDARQAPEPVQGQLTKEEADRLLEAIREDLQSLRREQLKKLKRSRAEKDW